MTVKYFVIVEAIDGINLSQSKKYNALPPSSGNMGRILIANMTKFEKQQNIVYSFLSTNGKNAINIKKEETGPASATASSCL